MRPIADFFGEISDTTKTKEAIQKVIAGDPSFAVGEWFATSNAFLVATPDDMVSMILCFCVRHEELSRSKPPIDREFIEAMRRLGPLSEFGKMLDDVKRYYMNPQAPRKKNYKRHLDYLFRRRMAAIFLSESKKNPPRPPATKRREVIFRCNACQKLFSFDERNIDVNKQYGCPDCHHKLELL